MPTHSIALVTDSTCDLPDAILAEHDIPFAPCLVIWGDEVYRDRVDLKAADFYRRLATDPRHPTTTQPTPADFVAVFQAAAKRGAREIVAIMLSSQLSGAYQSALAAQQMVALPVHVVDSRSVTMGAGWQVLAAARARARGADAAGMVAAAEAVRQRLALLVAMDTLEYLRRGGRIGGAAQFIGTLLNIKPLVSVDADTGVVEAVSRVRTRHRAVEALYDAFMATVSARAGGIAPEQGPLHVAVLHGNAPDDAAALAERLRRALNPAEVLLSITSPVLGVHTGPGALALAGYLGA